MKKIVINKCFGGFSLSDEAYEMYLKLKKIKFYKYHNIFGSDYYRVPKQKYDKYKNLWRNKDGDYRRINARNWFLSDRDIERDDKYLIKVVEKLGEKANGKFAELKIVEIPDNVDWEIDEYDGNEIIDEVHKSWD
jgi:hypothetical protein